MTASGGNSYAYDANGNMTTRVISGQGTSTLTYDAENRLVTVSGAATASFVYAPRGPPDNQRVKGTVGGVTTYYIGKHYEVEGGVIKKYYYAGDRRIAMRSGGALYPLLVDHLGSTAYTLSAASEFGEVRYKAFGATRFTSGTTPTTFRYTGQREESALGLYYYGARWYDPALGRFIQADTIIPNPVDAKQYDRYAYVLNNPLRYNDPTGHQQNCPGEEAPPCSGGYGGSGGGGGAPRVGGGGMGLDDMEMESMPATSRGGFFRSVGNGLRSIGKRIKSWVGGGNPNQPSTQSEPSQYKYDMVNNPGPLAELRGRPATNFAGGKYNEVVLEEDVVLYRAGQAGGGRNGLGQWFTRTPAQSEAQVRIDSAVRPQWKNSQGELTGTSPIESVYAVKIPKGTTVYEGPVANQGGIYVGGQNKTQLFVQEPWNIQGVEVLSETPIGR